MAQIAILERKCTGCGLCVENCPFGAIDMKEGHPELNAACKVCGICVKNCPEKAILKLETKVESVISPSGTTFSCSPRSAADGCILSVWS